MKFLKILVLLFILAALAVGGAAFWLYKSLNAAHAHNKTNQFIAIPKGSTPNEIIEKLPPKAFSPIRFRRRFTCARSATRANFKAGEYQFDSPITPLQVLEELEKGEERTIKLTIPEGFTRFDIAKRIAEKFPTNPPMDEKADSLFDGRRFALIKDFDPSAKNLEGYMYPSTYNLPKGTKPPQVIKTMVEQFKKIWKPEWNERARQPGQNAARDCDDCFI